MNIQPQPNDLFPAGIDADLQAPSVDQPAFMPEANSYSRFDSFLNERGLMPHTLNFSSPRSTIMPPDRAPSAPIIVPPSMSPTSFDRVYGNITEQQRASPEYSAMYYSQRPIDPRLPKPIEPAELTYSFGIHGPRPPVSDPLDISAGFPQLRQSGAGDSDDEAGSLTINMPIARIRNIMNDVVNDAIGSFEEKPRTMRAVSPVQLIQQDFPDTEPTISPEHSPGNERRSAIKRPNSPQRPTNLNVVPTTSDLISREPAPVTLQESIPVLSSGLGDLQNRMEGLSVEDNNSTGINFVPLGTNPIVNNDVILPVQQSPPQPQQPQPQQKQQGTFSDSIPTFVPRPDFLKAAQTVNPQQPSPLQQQPITRAFSPVSSSSPSSSMMEPAESSESYPSWLPQTDVVRSHSPHFTGANHQHTNRMTAGTGAGPMNIPVAGAPIQQHPTPQQQTPYTSAAMEMLTMQQMIDQLMPMARDQNGSRFIQMKLENSDLPERQILFEAIMPHIAELMCDIFGNYVVQKFYDIGTDEQKRVLCSVLRGRVVEMSKNAYGCRVVQKALETTPRDAQLDMCAELSKEVLPCVTDQNGNHVIQKCIETLPSSLVQFIVDAFLGRAVEMARHPYGCRVLQRIIEHCDPPQTTQLVSELLSAVHDMLTDPFGNYVIQHIMERGLPSQQEVIVNATHMRVVELSKHKFASNVMEKCVEFSNPELRSRTIINELLEGLPGQQRIFQLVADQYGNYVVQKMLDVCDAPTRDRILAVLRPNIVYLESLPYGRHILQCMARFDASVNAYLPASPVRNTRRRNSGSSSLQIPQDSRGRGDRSSSHRNNTGNANGIPRYLH